MIYKGWVRYNTFTLLRAKLSVHYLIDFKMSAKSSNTKNYF